MRVNLLASSSKGNSTHISQGDASILIDAGISATQTVSKSGTEDFDGIFISHEHSDHVKGLGPVGRRTGAPIYMHPAVKKKVKSKLKDCDVNEYMPGESITIKDKLKITNFSTRHDSVYSYGFIIEDLVEDVKLGFLTDTGSWTKLIVKSLKDCDFYVIESDYDVEGILNYDKYDEFLKERIMSDWGHLSNKQAFELLEELDLDNLDNVVFSHMSERTNSPEMIKTAAREFMNTDEVHFAPCSFEIKGD